VQRLEEAGARRFEAREQLPLALGERFCQGAGLQKQRQLVGQE